MEHDKFRRGRPMDDVIYEYKTETYSQHDVTRKMKRRNREGWEVVDTTMVGLKPGLKVWLSGSWGRPALVLVHYRRPTKESQKRLDAARATRRAAEHHAETVARQAQRAERRARSAERRDQGKRLARWGWDRAARAVDDITRGGLRPPD